MSPSTRSASRAAAALAERPAKRRASTRRSEGSRSRSKKQKYDSNTPDRSVKSTSKKSKYFRRGNPRDLKYSSKHSSKPKDEAVSENEDHPDSPSPDPDWDSPEESSSVHDSSEHEGMEEELASEQEKKGRPSLKRKSGSAQKSSNSDGRRTHSDPPASAKKKELWREGVRTGLGPGKEVFIRKPKARDPGDVPYKEDTLHPNTLLFLKDLADNNERQWMKAHDADYRTSKQDWEAFVETLTEKIVEQDSTIPELPAKDLVFRIHRDIRFSKDPTPYKTHFSAAWSRTGKKGPYAAYYVHCQPGSCFVGSGLWHPEADQLALLRQDIDTNSQRLKAVLRAEGMRREIFGGIPDDEGKAVKAFVNHNSDSALKTKPKGYEYDNENIQLLRLRSFTIGKPLSDEDLLSPNAQEKIATIIGIMEPFVTYLNSVVMPDP